MLNSIRGALKGVVAWLFAIVGIAAFSIVGVPELRNFQQKPPIRIGTEEVSRGELLDTFNLQLRRQQADADRKFTREEAVSSGLPQQVVAELANQAAVRLETKRLNLTMPRQTVQEILSRNEIFQNKLTGKFDETVLATVLRQNQLTARQFDRMIRDDLLRQTLVNATSTGPDAPKALADIYLARQTENREITWLSVTDAMSGEATEPTPDDLKAWYDTHPAAYTSPEFRTFSVAFLRNQDFEEGLDVDEDELKSIYETNKATLYSQPEKRTLYQLTYSAEGDAVAAVARLRDGTPFEIIAREKDKTLEEVTLTQTTKAGMIDQTVAEAAFIADATPGTILDPVVGLFGTTVVQIVETTPEEIQTLEEVRDEIRSAVLERQTQKLVYEKLETIEGERDTGTNLREAATAANVELKTFGPVDRFSFTPGGAILDGIPGEVLQEGFELFESEESEAVELTEGSGYVIFVVDEIQDPALKPYEDVAADVETAWRNDKRAARIAKTTQDIIDRANAGETLAEIGESYERAPITEKLSINNRQHQFISADLQGTIFSADKGKAVKGDARGGGTTIVAIVNDVTFARGSIAPQQLGQYRQFLGLQLNQELVGAYIQTIQEEYGVEINQPVIDATFSLDEG